MTVTVTSYPTTCSATTVQPATSPEASESGSTPVVIVPGTQSMTATYNVPVGGGQHATTAYTHSLLTACSYHHSRRLGCEPNAAQCSDLFLRRSAYHNPS